jgi:hypothetical protein
MYDRFTDRARKVMGLARQEAQRFNHDYIGTEHLLLGLIGEGSGVAACVLKKLGISLESIRHWIDKLISTGTTMVTMGQLPLTPRAKKVLELSLEASSRLGHTYIGTEHLLLGLIREKDGIAAQVLSSLYITSAIIEREIMIMLSTEEEVASIPKCSKCGLNKIDHITRTDINNKIVQVNICNECNNKLNLIDSRKILQEGSLINRSSAISVDVIQEIIKATKVHGKFNGPHEGWAVIMEEVDELWDEVKAKHHDKNKMRNECIQIAAMAFRYIMDICEDK